MISYILRHPIAFLFAASIHLGLITVFATTSELTKPLVTILQLEDIIEFKHELDTNGTAFEKKTQAKEKIKDEPLKTTIVDEQEVNKLINSLKSQRETEIANAIKQQKQIKQQTKFLIEKQKSEINKAKKLTQKIQKENLELQKNIEKNRKKTLEEQEQAKKAEATRLKKELEAKELEKQAKLEEQRIQKLKAEARKVEQEKKLMNQIASKESEELRRSREQQLSKLKEAYVDTIAAHVKKSWRKPLTNINKGDKCIVSVTQTEAGEIVSVVITSCSSNVSKLFRDSVEQATYRADPLPTPESSEVFDRNIKFEFLNE